MGRAIGREWGRSFDFGGRTSRGSYLAFLLSAVTLYAGLLCTARAAIGPEVMGRAILVLAFVLYVPVTSAGVRRLRDAGEPGHLMLEPLKPAFVLAVAPWLGMLMAGGLFSAAPGWATPVLGFGAISGLWLILWYVALLIAVIATLVLFSNTMSKLLLPTKPITGAMQR